ncbi:MAG: ParA family protein [Pseudomonadota bacterium]|nr:ParA family protein [Pseudomonadota bacterium]
MSNRVISVVQLKPGSGKTTLATSLAGELSRWQRVALIDCHPLSRRAATWGARRQNEVYSDRLLVQAASTASALLERVYRVRDEVEYVVLDGSSDPKMTKAMAAIAHLCLVPVAPTDDADEQCAGTLALLREARQLKRFRVRGVTIGQVERRYREPAQLRAVKVVSTVLCERRAYADALEHGRTAAEYGHPIARDELHGLAMEVADLLRHPAFGAPKSDVFAATITQMPLGPRSMLRL